LIEAYLQLFWRTKQVPTGAAIARKTGCSRRLVYERLESIAVPGLAAFDYMTTHHALAPEVGADRHTRIERHVERRARTCESRWVFYRILVAAMGTPPSLSTRVAAVRERMKADLTPNWMPFRNPSAAPRCDDGLRLRGMPA
jgi:hypothetical protein